MKAHRSFTRQIILFRLDARQNTRIHYNSYQKYIEKEICSTQRKSAIAAITPRADRKLETVKDEALLNTVDTLAELLFSVVEPELVPAPAVVGEEAVTGKPWPWLSRCR